MKDKKIRAYLLWAFGIAWVLQAAASLFLWNGNGALYTLTLAISMFAPLFGVLLSGIPLQNMGWRPRLKGKAGWVAAAWLAPALLGTLGTAFYFLVFPARLDLSGAYLLQQGGAAMLEQLAGAGITMPLLIAIQAVSAISYAPLINMLFAVGEEAGWRGVLYPYLKTRLGRVKGLVTGGVIWGVWHWPIMLLAGYEYGSDYWGAPWLGMALFCLIAVAMGVLLDVVYEKTQCIWVPALAHGALNAFAGVPLLLLSPGYLDQMTLGPTLVGIVGGLPMLLAAAWALFRKKR